MSEKIDITSINKFHGKNYHQWKFQLSCALRAKGLFGITKGIEVIPVVTATSTLAEVTAYV